MRKYLLTILLFIIYNTGVLKSESNFEIEDNQFKKNINSLSLSQYNKDNIDFSAQNINYNLKNETITATGNVTFVSEGNIVTTDTLFYDIKNDILYLKGNIVFINEYSDTVYSNESTFDPKLNTALIEQFNTVFSDNSTLKAETGSKLNRDTYNLKKMNFTACRIIRGCKPTWEIKSKNAVYNQTESEIVLYNAWFETKGIPILWTPYFSFSNLNFSRKPGFLTPSFENNSLYGLTFIVPVYLPLGEHQDIELFSYAFLESNYLFLMNYKGMVENGSFSSSSSFVNKQNDKREIDQNYRWHFFLDMKKDLNDIWRTSLIIEEVSDIYYLRNYNLNKKNTAESFYVDKLEFEGFFNQNSYFDTYIVNFKTINANSTTISVPKSSTNDSIPNLNNNLNINYSYFSDHSFLGRINLFMNLDNLFTNNNNNLSRFVTNISYKYYIPTFFGNYSVDALAQNVFYSDSLSKEIIVEDNSITSVATALTYEYPLLYEINNFVYSLSPVVQLSYSKNLDKNNNKFLIDSYNININSSNLFELDHYQGFDRFEESRDLKYALKFSLLNDTNQGSRIFIGQRFKTEVKDSFFQNINESSASNYFISVYLYPISSIYIMYNGMIDKDFKKVDTSLSTGYSNNMFSINTTFDEYNNLDKTLYNLDRISELRLFGIIYINENITVNANYLFNISPSYSITPKTANFNFSWSNECLEIIFYTSKDFYMIETANSFGFKINIKSIAAYDFSL